MIEYLFLDIEWNAKNNSKNISDWSRFRWQQSEQMQI